MTTRGTAWACALLLVLISLTAATAAPKRVLLVHSFGLGFSPYSEYAVQLRAELARQSPDPMDIYEVSLETARFVEGEPEEPFVQYLDALFAQRRLDLVITIGAPAAGFFQRYRERAFPATPVLFTLVDQRRLKDSALTANDATVAVSIDTTAVIDNILAVLPQTDRIAVVMGASPLERFWLAQIRQEFQRFTGRVEFIWPDESSFDEMLKRAAALPPRSAIFFGLLAVDAAGNPHEGEKALTALHAAANAPIFSYVDAQFGRGLVGGPMISLAALSQRAATAAVRILRGERPGEIVTPAIGFAAPVFDWRELRRWEISEALLPPGSIVQFREPTVWHQYKWYIVAAAALCMLQTAFIVILLMNRRRLRRADAERHQAEEAAHELSGRLINAAEEERARVARELHDDVTQRLALLAIDAGREERKAAGAGGGTAATSMRESLVRLSEDVHALSYRLHPSILEDLGLVEALKSECTRFTRSCSIRLEADARNLPDRLPQDVALCLFRIAQEGLRNITRHAAAQRADVSLRRLDGGLQLVIKDDGAGFDPARHRNGTSLGHASMRQRAFLLGGRVEIHSSPGRGTIVQAWVPVKEAYGEPSACPAG